MKTSADSLPGSAADDYCWLNDSCQESTEGTNLSAREEPAATGIMVMLPLLCME